MLKLGFRLSIGIQHRVFVIPWIKSHSAPARILCSEKRDYSSSGLSKYVPKKSRKTSEELTYQPVDISEIGIDASILGSEAKARDGTFLDLQEENDAGSYMNESFDDSNEGVMSLEKGINASRWDHSVFGSKMKGNFKEAGEGTVSRLQDKNNAGMSSSVSTDDESSEELEESRDDVRSRGYMSKVQHKKVFDEVKLHMEAEKAKSSGEACKTTQEAENMAIRYLGLRAYTAVELKKKLIGKKYPNEIADRVINDFQNRGFINDSLYAESFSRSRWSSLSWGPRRIKQALYQKGISNKDSEAAIKLVFEKGQCGEEDEEPETKHGMSKEAVDQLYVQASKRWHQGRDLPIENRKARVIRWLQYRGFNWGVVSQLLKRLESQQS
ncbi:unnamed protein product [Microthlaspi erraticum]|uniref:Regulatory protein RecX n=1 Tax=Microthlaspi erraticum TaxID=1685480 RepID=A0A6D2HIY7_9BRAS|nr:unnamed protein product [Microthlaspi erraticum]